MNRTALQYQRVSLVSETIRSRQDVDKTLFRPLSTISLKDEFILRMEELIFDGDLKSGDKLPPERELARLFGISRPVVHEGILILEARGLVRIRPRHGVVVRDYRRSGTLDLLLSLLNRPEHEIGPLIVRDLERVRIKMEQDMTQLICESSEDIKMELRELTEINELMKGLTDPEEIAREDFRFHLVLALASGNAVYALLENTLRPAHMHLLGRFYRNPSVLERVVVYHEKFIELLAKKNLEKLMELIEKADSYQGYL